MRSEKLATSTTAFFVTLCLLLAAVPTASAQTYTFSACSGVPIPGSPVYTGLKGTFTYTINKVLFGGPVSVAGATGYSYHVMATYTASTAEGQARNFSNVESDLTIGYLPGLVTPAGRTTFGITLPAGGGIGAWAVQLLGDGNLMPNGIAQPIPPISVWTTTTNGVKGDYVSVDSATANAGTLYYLIDTLGPCGASGTGANPKALGNSLSSPGCIVCGDPPDPIDVGSGNLFEEFDDYHTSGPNQLGLTRYYNSMSAANTFATSLGAGWRFCYDRYLRLVSATSVVAERPDGQQLTFTLTAGAWTADTDVDFKLTNTGSNWNLADNQDTVESYTNASSTEAILHSIRARNGYTQTLQYNTANQLTTVTDSFQRQLSFTYANGLLETVTTPDGLVLTYGYTGQQFTSVSYSTTPVTSQTYLYENTSLPNALTGVIDENGNRYTTWTYDSLGRALTSQHAGGAGLTTVAYNDTDGSRTITNPLGVQELYKFTTLQGVPKVTEIDRLATSDTAVATKKFTYDANGYLSGQTDWNGNLTSYINDVHGRPLSMVEAAGTSLARTTATTYHPTFHLPVKRVESGLTTTYTYDTNGQLLTQSLTDTTTTAAPYSTGGQTRTRTYTWSNFRLASRKTPRTDVNGVTTFTYDSTGALIAFTNALGRTTQISQNLPGGLPQSIIDQNGVPNTLTYDPRLRLLTNTLNTAAGPLTTTYNYDVGGNLLSVQQPDGSTMTNSYDAAHRLNGVTDLFGQSISYMLDASGNSTNIAVLDTAGNQQRIRSEAFDSLGRLRQDTGGAGQVTAYTYDSDGNALTITDPLNHFTQQAFDALERRTTVTDPAKGVVSTTYDAHNRPFAITDPNGGVTSFVYDGFGDLIQRISPDTGTTVYRYDPDGNLIQRVDAAGATVNYTYDTLDRITGATYPADPAENIAYTYDESGYGFSVGRLTTVSDAAGTLNRTYDERGNVLTETRQTLLTGGGATLVTTYTYDPAGRIASVAYPSGWMVSYNHDAMGRVAAVSVQQPGVGSRVSVLSAIGYQPFGPVNAFTFGNGISQTRSFDPDYRPTALADTGASPIQSLTYTYDTADNISSIADGVTPANSQQFRYDALNHLTVAAGAYGNVSYTYDLAGNRLSQNQGGSATAYTYAPHTNQLTSVSSGGVAQNVGLTKAGQVNNWVPSAASVSVTYNQGGRLSAVTSASGPLAQYTYDAFGQRVAKLGAVTGTTLYQYDQGGRLLEETDGQGNSLAGYIYFGALPAATFSAATGQVYFLHNDRVGTPLAATDGNQTVVWAASYGPFGEMTTVPANIVQDLRFPGQEFDLETGLYHNGFRDYVPAWGRFLQSDPLGIAGGINTYGYAQSNPLVQVDPLGLDTFGLGIEAPNQSAVSNGVLNADVDTGHTFAYLKDDSGTITYIASVGPAGQIGSFSDKLNSYLGQTAASNLGFGFAAEDNWPVSGQVYAYEWQMNPDQIQSCAAAFAALKKDPGNYAPKLQCTSAAINLAKQCGIQVPDGVSPVSVDILGTSHVSNLPNPWGLQQQLQQLLKQNNISPAPTIPATQFHNAQLHLNGPL